MFNPDVQHSNSERSAVSQRLVSAGVLFDCQEGVVIKDGVSHRPEPKVFAVLHCLLKQPGVIVTKEKLQDEVWGEVIVTEHALNYTISRLRKVLGDRPNAPQFIETVSKRGYRWLPPVSNADLTPAALTLAASDVVAPIDTTRTKPHRRYLVAIAAVFAIVALSLWWWPTASRTPLVLAAPVLHATTTDDAAQLNSLFDDLARGLSTEPVLAITITRDNSSDRALQIHSELDRRVNPPKLRLRLLDQQNVLWSDEWTWQTQQALSLKRSITFRLLEVLRLPGAVASEPQQKMAFVAYAQGLQASRHRHSEGMRTAAGYFQQALAIDPQYLPALTGLVSVHAQLLYYDPAARLSAEATAKDYLQRAQQLAPNQALVIGADGVLDLYSGRLIDAQAKLQRALTLDSHNSDLRYAYGQALSDAGNLIEAEAQFQQVLNDDPLRAFVRVALAEIYERQGRFDAALTGFKQAIDMNDDQPGAWWGLGYVAMRSNQMALGIHSYDEALKRSRQQNNIVGSYAIDLLRFAERERAQQLLNGVAVEDDGWLTRAYFHLLFSEDPERAYRWLNSKQRHDPEQRALQAWAALATGRDQEALTLYTALMRDAESRTLFEDFDYLHEGLYHPLAYAAALQASGDRNGADREWQAALQRLSQAPLRDDQTAEIHYLRTIVLTAVGQHEAATREWQLTLQAGFRYDAWHQFHPVWRVLKSRPLLTR